MNQTVLVTGACGGIGKALCKRFFTAGYSLVCVDKSYAQLQALKQAFSNTPSKIYCIKQDLRKPDSPTLIYEEVKRQNLNIDILVNAAGFGIYGDFLDQGIEENQALIDVNISGLMKLCHLFAADMKERGSGAIINFSSISAFFPGKLMSGYYASKAFVLSFSIALAEELKKYNIRVLAICPDVIDTPFYEKAHADRLHSYLLNRLKPKKVSTFSKKAFKAIQHRRRYYVLIGLRAKLLVFFSIFVPKRIQVKIIGFIQAKVKKNS